MLKSVGWYVCDACGLQLDARPLSNADLCQRQMDPLIEIEHIFRWSAGDGEDYDVLQEATLLGLVAAVSMTVEHGCRNGPGYAQHCCDRHFWAPCQQFH